MRTSPFQLAWSSTGRVAVAVADRVGHDLRDEQLERLDAPSARCGSIASQTFVRASATEPGSAGKRQFQLPFH